MIQANELRLNNWVTYNPSSVDEGTEIKPLQVNCVDSYFGVLLNDGFTNAYGFDEILPIPLTPEILKKCGFVEIYKSEFVHQFDFDKDTTFGAGWTVNANSYLRHFEKRIYIKSLHQLIHLQYDLCVLLR